MTLELAPMDLDQTVDAPDAAAVTPSVPQPESQTDRPRVIGARTLDERMSLLGAFVASFCTVWVLYEQVLPFSGSVGFFVCWYLAFVGLYATVSALSESRPIVIDRVASAVVHGGAAIVGLALVTTLFYTFVKGFPAYIHPNFFTKDMAGVGPQAPLNQGGILHALVGSLLEVLIAVAVSLPLGIATAVYMTEFRSRLANVVRTVVEAMTALPDLVAGLFIYAVLIVGLHWGRTGLAAALALAVTMLPIIARSSEVTLRVVPSGLREASLALGASQLQTLWRVVLPTARTGLGTALILGVARGIGETAPVLITSGASTFFNANPVRNPMNSLPLYVYSAVRSGEPTNITRGYGAASVLLAVVLILFIFVRLLSRSRVRGT